LNANSPETLKNVILNVIRSGERQTDIRVTDYPGDLTSLALSALLNEIQTREPIAAYTVEYMAFDLTSVLSQHTIALTIVYRHDDPPDIMQVRGRRGLEEAVWAALEEYKPGLTVEMHYFHALEHNPEEMARAFYYNYPAWAMELPQINLSLYPAREGFLHRIVEIELIWQAPVEELKRKTKETEDAAWDLLMEMHEFSGSREEQAVQEILWVDDALRRIMPYDRDSGADAAESNPYTAHGALVNRIAAGEGYALAFKLLCDMLEIENIVVTGHRLGEEDGWNLVKIGENWHHISVALNRSSVFLACDETAGEFLQWDKSLYPAAQASEWTVERILELAG
jgi:hypothetical protein